MSLFLKRLLSYLPTQLPTGVTAFDKWVDEIIELTGQLADRDSMKFVICSFVIHLDPDQHRVPKNFFVKRIRVGAAKQIGAYCFGDIKAKKDQEKAQPQPEVTPQVASDEKV